jgi:hypothetical protein
MPSCASCDTHPKMNPASKIDCRPVRVRRASLARMLPTRTWQSQIQAQPQAHHIWGICSRHDLKPEFYFGTGISGIFGIEKVNDAVVNSFKKTMSPPWGGAQ